MKCQLKVKERLATETDSVNVGRPVVHLELISALIGMTFGQDETDPRFFITCDWAKTVRCFGNLFPKRTGPTSSGDSRQVRLM